MSSNEIWVITEIRDGRLSSVTPQLLGAAQILAEKKSMTVVAVLLGGQQTHADELAGFASHVLWISNPSLNDYESSRTLGAVWQLVSHRGTPRAMIAGASSTGSELMPRLAARASSGYLSACVGLRFEGEAIAARRPIHGGKVYEEVAFVSDPAVLTVRPGTFDAAKPQGAAGDIEIIPFGGTTDRASEFVDRQTVSTAHKDVSEASCVVAGGRGMGQSENFKMIESLAKTLDASVGASRAVVDAGWRPHDEQVGKSGKTISPDLYIACGISGMIHHTLGMNTSKKVVAINSDPDAMIFQNADYGLVGDATTLVPELEAALKAVLKRD